MKRICIVCPYPLGVAPSQRLKFEQYYSFFESNGWEVSIHSFQTLKFWNLVYKKNKVVQKIFWTIYGYISRLILLFTLRKYDIVYIHLYVTPFGYPFFEKLYRLIAKRIIYDIDDLVYLENASSANSWISKLKGKQKSIYLMKHADCIITTTPYLIEFCKKFNSRVEGIPPTLDENIIFPKEKSFLERIIIGWSGSHSTLRYLSIVESALQKIASKFNIEFLVFGVNEYALEGVNTKIVPWSSEIENEIFNEMDIAIYPQEKELWSEGKYGGKMIQYLAAGLPMVISNSNSLVPIVIQNMENGIIVENTSADWEKAILKLIEEKVLRKKLSIKARELFLNKFSVEANKANYLRILNSTLQ